MVMQITATAEREHLFPAWVDGRETSLQQDYEAAQARIAASINGKDLLDELFDVADELANLARAGDCETLGAVVVAVQRAYVQSLTDREMFGKPGAGCKSAREAACEAIEAQVQTLKMRNALDRAHLEAQAARFA